MPGLLPALACLLLLSLPGPSAGSDDDGTVVLTTSGPIRGKRLPVGSSSVTAFLGVPYAQPPLGALRFQKPLPHPPWSHVLEATGFGHACPQPPLTGYPDAKLFFVETPQSEDCLFLNVWVPHPRPPEPVPVLVWIHGGGFYMGATSVELHSGRFLAATENVIVASMNYRLGALGFLYLPPAAPGNAGLWDQRLALRWLRNNVAAFGGDPARVMLFGQSAGAASVGLHLLSPGSQPLFTRAALQSGAATGPWAWVSPVKAKERGRRLAQLLGCPEGNDTALVGCLQGQEPEAFPKHEFSVLQYGDLTGMPFAPTPDGDFLLDTPPHLLEARYLRRMPILTGVTANEGSYLLSSSLPSLHLENASTIGPEQLMQVARLVVPGAPEEAIRAVAQQYSEQGANQGEARYRWAMEQILGDYFIVCPVAEVAGQAAKAGSPVYAYYFTHRSSTLTSAAWTGVPHSSELLFTLGSLASRGGANRTHTEAEAGLRRRVMRYWATFARSGHPTEAGNSEEQWPRYVPRKENFFHIGMKTPQVEVPSPARRCRLLAWLLKKSTREHQ
ncbi:acetylcholinesterase-like [Pelodiscus sinensis]|uniref:acetylcholinesterase-like n=1 Tax=Pelodiscus sinensis TaxID=13735 RepID=UPI003F6BB292